MIKKLTKKLFKNGNSQAVILPTKWLTVMFRGEDHEGVKMEFKKDKIIISRGKNEIESYIPYTKE